MVNPSGSTERIGIVDNQSRSRQRHPPKAEFRALTLLTTSYALGIFASTFARDGGRPS